MKVAFVFAALPESSPALAPHATADFAHALRSAGVTARVFATDRAGGIVPVASKSSPGLEDLGSFGPDVVQTIGAVGSFAACWDALARTGIPIVHFAVSGGPVMGGPTQFGAGWMREQPGLHTATGRAARRASRAVAALVASNRADMARYRDLGFFASIRRSIVSLPPVAVSSRRSSDGGASAVTARPAGSGAPMTIGYFDPIGNARSLAFLLDAAATFGPPRYTISVAPAALARLAPAGKAGFLRAAATHDADDFIGSIDALVVPYPDDAFAEIVVRAVAAGQPVIAPDTGPLAELADFGRRGILFATGQVIQLGGALNDAAIAWESGAGELPIRVDASELTASASPAAAAERLADLYADLAHPARTAEPAVVANAAPALSLRPASRLGCVVLARSNPRLLAATLNSIARQSRHADSALVLVPRERQHVVSEVVDASAPPIRLVAPAVTADCRMSGLHAMAADADVAVLVPEGTVLAPDHLRSVEARFAALDDLVGRLDVVDRRLSVDSPAVPAEWPDMVRDTPLHRLYRRALRPRSLMGAVLTIRPGLARGIAFDRLPETCDWLAFSLFLQRLRARGRVEVHFADAAYQVTLRMNLRRNAEASRELMHALYRAAVLPEGRQAGARLELPRFVVDPLVQSITRQSSLSSMREYLAGLASAWREDRRLRRTLRRDVREMA